MLSSTDESSLNLEWPHDASDQPEAPVLMLRVFLPPLPRDIGAFNWHFEKTLFADVLGERAGVRGFHLTPDSPSPQPSPPRMRITPNVRGSPFSAAFAGERGQKVRNFDLASAVRNRSSTPPRELA